MSLRGTIVLGALVAGAAAGTISDASAQGVCDGVSQVANTNLTKLTIASGLTTGTNGPLYVTAPPGDTNRIFIVLQNGIIRQLVRGALPTASTVFLDIDARVNSVGDEQGLLGLAFDPNFATNGTFYVNYTMSGGDTIISRFRTIDETPGTAGDPASEQVLLRIDQPESNHNGGWMGFGPDGFLYIAQGDGGGGGDIHGSCGNGQNMQTLLGKMLRIDPTGATGTAPDCGLDPGPYTVPLSNPYRDGTGTGDCDEIWDLGLRNPWRNSFDALNGDLYIGDVGQGCWEEINWTANGAGKKNFGWRLFEGRHCYNSGQGCSATASPAGCGPACSDPVPVGDPIPNGTTLPIWDYTSSVGTNCTIVSGYVYRGCRMSQMQGTYFYGDYCAGTISSFVNAAGVPTNHLSWTAVLGAGLSFSLTSFGVDGQGEMYITDRDGLVSAIVPPLPDFEVSGTGTATASQLLLSKDAAWTWEDLTFSSRHPVTAYRVYRADIVDGIFTAGEIFNCVRTGPGNSWAAGGDLVNPSPGGMFAYVVTALNGATQTSPGGTPVRTLGAASCP